MDKLSFRVSPKIAGRLEVLSTKTGRTKSYYFKKALERFLEDEEDYLLAVARLEENNERIPYEKIRKELGLDD
jgi:RHH-type transcriptional regulator, rel operon repressor / antitoxin RelB